MFTGQKILWRNLLVLAAAIYLLAATASAGERMRAGVVTMNDYIFWERLEDVGRLTAGAGDIQNVTSVGRRLPGGGAVNIKDTYLKWPVEASGDYFVEFWLKPVGWDGTTSGEIEISRFVIGGSIYRLYKSAAGSELLLEADGRVLQNYPVYNWTEQGWIAGYEQARWHFLNISVRDGSITLSVNGFPARAVSSARVSGELSEFMLLGSKGTSFSELVIAKGYLSGDELRERYRSLYMGVPAFQENVITVPFVRRAPVIDGRIDEDEYSEFTRLVGFIHNRGKGAGSFEGSGVTGYIGYNPSNLYLALRTPYRGTLRAKHWGEHDMPLWGEESYEVFLCPPWEETPEYVQLVGNPYGDRADIRAGAGTGMDGGWVGRWFWKTNIEEEEWTGELHAPFSGINIQSPGSFSVWTMNIFNSDGFAAWNQAGAYHDTGSFVEMRFDRNAPVIRPEGIRIEGSDISIPIELIGRGRAREFTYGLEIYGKKDTLPFKVDTGRVTLGPGEKKKVSLGVSAGEMKEGRLVFFVKEGNTFLYSRSGLFPFAEPVVRRGAL